MAVRHRHVITSRKPIFAPLLRPEEESLLLVLVVDSGDVHRAAEGITVVVLLVGRSDARAAGVCAVEVILRVEEVVAHKLVGIAVELIRPALGFNLDRAGTVAAVLGAIVRGEYFELSNGVDAGIDVQRAVAAVVHVVAAVEFPVVVLGATAIHAKGDAAVDADLRLIHSGLVAHARDQAHQGREIPAVEFELGKFFPGDCAREFGGLGLDLGHVGAFDDDLCADGANFEGDVDTGFFPHVQHHALGLIFLKAGGGNDDVVVAGL